MVTNFCCIVIANLEHGINSVPKRMMTIQVAVIGRVMTIRVAVIASEAKQSRYKLLDLDCFVPRNDEKK